MVPKASQSSLSNDGMVGPAATRTERQNNPATPIINSAIDRDTAQPRKTPRNIEQLKDKHNFENALLDIDIAISAIVAPLAILTSVFIGVVFYFSLPVSQYVQSTPSLFQPSLTILDPSIVLDSAYFVAIDSARLVTIASWTSTAISFLLPWAMVLYSYRVAKSFQNPHSTDLPTPLQLWLLIDLLKGNFGALLNWTSYRISKPRKRRTNTELAKAAAVSFTFMISAILVLLADTWLHLTTTSVLLQRTIPSSGEAKSFSRILSQTCRQNAQNCTVLPSAVDGASKRIVQASDALRTLFNVSTSTTVLPLTVDDQQYAFYAPAHIPQNVSYRASTLGMKTKCNAISRACHLRVEGTYPIELPFHCSSSYYGNLVEMDPTNGLYPVTYFEDSGLTKPINWTTDRNMFVDYQTSYLSTGVPWVHADLALYSDPEILQTFNSSAAFMLECTSSFLQMNYSLANGQIQDVEVRPADDKAIFAMTYPWQVNHDWGYVTLGLRQACLEQTVDEMAASFARTYSHDGLSTGVGAVEPAPALHQSSNRLEQISRLPKGPFFTLLALNCVYALMGIVLAISALASNPRAVKAVQARLSGMGLVAALFEGDRAKRPVNRMSDLFAENAPGPNLDVRATLLQTSEGGWQFKSISKESIKDQDDSLET